jgi:hypothetical protein
MVGGWRLSVGGRTEEAGAPANRQPSTVNRECDIAVVGAGAAGLTAAMFAKRTAPDARVIALDGAPKIGAKILISGGGRCNVTHYAVTADDFNGNRNAIARVLRTFPVEETVAWLAGLGVTLKREETGKLFPTTDRAKTVIDALLRGCEGVEIRTNARIQSIERGFALDGITAKRVILATGGRSVPKTGSDGHGYALAQTLGHTVTATFPALVPLVLESESLPALKCRMLLTASASIMTFITSSSTSVSAPTASASSTTPPKHPRSLNSLPLTPTPPPPNLSRRPNRRLPRRKPSPTSTPSKAPRTIRITRKWSIGGGT